MPTVGARRTPAARGDDRASARVAFDQGLESWGLRLDDCIARLAIPSRFGCSVIKVERNGYVITDTGPNLRVYPGDKVMLLGQDEHLAAARDFLLGDKAEAAQTADAFNGSVLATEVLANVPRAGRTLAELQVARDRGAHRRHPARRRTHHKSRRQADARGR